MALRENLPPKVDEKMESIQQAVSVLNEAAHESTEELKGALREFGRTSLVSAVKARDQIVESSKIAAENVNSSAHNYPWAFIGGAALVGFLLGRKSNKSD